MNAIVRRVIKTAALAATFVSAGSFIALIVADPDAKGWKSVVGDNALLVLFISTPIAAALLAVVLRGWARFVALSAFAPALFAAGLIALFELVPSLHSPALTLVGFVLVELALPVTALLVAVAALALAVEEIRSLRRWLTHAE